MYEHENKMDIDTRSSSATAAPRRAVGCGKEPSRCSLCLPLLLHLPSLPSCLLLLCLQKRGRSSPERRIRYYLPLAIEFLITTVGLRNPTSLSPMREKGDKVFGERSARLLTGSSRTFRTPTTTSPTTTSSPTSTTSSTTWLATTSTPRPVLLPLLHTSLCSFCLRPCYNFLL